MLKVIENSMTSYMLSLILPFISRRGCFVCFELIKRKFNGYLKCISLENIYKFFYEKLKNQLISLTVFYTSNKNDIKIFLK